ncbi:hypothetical protein [Niastella populi]|uniref:Uncharacterized protein n=1 Tax=Niastella populi TaxID=550983 RepID=A0A1V9GB45_9BACT|nr:hypothetical protein [Niastella populi]OQP67688.1 hypothetical protein A4R26_11535 [Niastella populi]
MPEPRFETMPAEAPALEGQEENALEASNTERALTPEEQQALIASEMKDETAVIARQAEAAQTQERIGQLRQELGIESQETTPGHGIENEGEKRENNSLLEKESDGDSTPSPEEKVMRIINNTGNENQPYKTWTFKQTFKEKPKKRPSFFWRLLKFLFSGEKASFKKGLEIGGFYDQDDSTKKESANKN